MFCAKCGVSVLEGSQFCVSCGSPVAATAFAERLAGARLLLVPGATAGEDLALICGRAPVPDGVTPAIRAHAQYTSVDSKYLPSACRE